MNPVHTETDVIYASIAGRELRCDLHWPVVTPGPLTVAIYLHGGGWARGSRADRAEERLAPVAGAGIAVASIEYRLSREARWPAQLDDVRAAIDAVPRLFADRGVAVSGRIALWGCSAGGHVALMAALTAAETGEAGAGAVVDAVVAWFPPTDLTLMTDAPASPGARMPAFLPPGAAIPPFERMLLGLGEEEDDESVARLRDASPVSHAAPDVCPVLLIHGDEDALIPASHSDALRDVLLTAGSPVSMLLVRGATHEDPLFDAPAVLGATAAHLKGSA
ncbi:MULTISPECIES: alpha/beta hydrolase [unclassified Microbacterium]|uniref:alpha/beta hydrolase n=1 Tax=unclassified Microbacterium TaxID=2609290 RepID=UPI000C2C8CD7|nr:MULTISPECIES: alpha/beta hydrolase [unclassified Microbacterium]